MEQISETEHTTLAHWTYTREEWRSFMRWTQRKKSFFHWLLYRFSPGLRQFTPEVRVTPGRVWIGKGHRHFSGIHHKLKRVNIIDEGKFNIMEITFEDVSGRSQGLDEIRFPVPKGKLREAIALQERIFPSLEPAGC